jgi:putative AdoMet-dependent methyltransferase
MEAIARPKVSHLTNRRFIKADILEVFARQFGPFDVVISTYAIHHLTDQEKQRLFTLVFDRLVPRGRAVFGDLMIRNADQKREKVQQYLLKGDRNTAQAIAEEFFWLIDPTVAVLQGLGFDVRVIRFSDLSYGMVVEKPNSV